MCSLATAALWKLSVSDCLLFFSVCLYDPLLLQFYTFWANQIKKPTESKWSAWVKQPFNPSPASLFPFSLWTRCLGLSNKHAAAKVTPTCRDSLLVRSSRDMISVECACFALCSSSHDALLCALAPTMIGRGLVSCFIFRNEADPGGQRNACFDTVIPTWKLRVWVYTGSRC